MTVKEIYTLCDHGQTEEAYDAIRDLYATDKSPYVATCMFWVANKILTRRIVEKRVEEADKIVRAMERVLVRMSDREGKAREALQRQQQRLEATQYPSAYHLELGKWGEDIAAKLLQEKGYVILERDWHSKHRDIDIIAIDGDYLVFIEVKTRSNTDFAPVEKAMNFRKRQNINRSINHYVKSHHVTRRCRFDLITVVGSIGVIPQVNHIVNYILFRP